MPDLHRMNSSGLVDLMDVLEDVIPVEMLVRFKEEYKTPGYSNVSTVGERLAECHRCGAIVDPDSSIGSAHHDTWHQNISIAMWLLQAFVIAHLSDHEKEEDAEELRDKALDEKFTEIAERFDKLIERVKYLS